MVAIGLEEAADMRADFVIVKVINARVLLLITLVNRDMLVPS